MTLVIEDIGRLFELKEFGEIGESIFLNTLPDKANNVISITQYTSSNQSLRIKDTYMSYQVRVRNESHAESARISQALYELLFNEGDRSFISTSGKHIVIRKLKFPNYLVTDELNRVSYIFNMEVITRPF